APVEIVWLDDDLPTGAKVNGSQGPESWKWANAPVPVHHGARSHTTDRADGQVQHLFIGAEPLAVESKQDVLFAHVFIDPKEAPSEIMLQWNDGTWDHRAYWGANSIGFGADNTPSRMRLGDIPKSGEWVRLEIPVSRVGLRGGSNINGI